MRACGGGGGHAPLRQRVRVRAATLSFVARAGLFCIPALSRYIEERVLFLRERAGGAYGTGAYYIATALVELPVLMCVVVAYAPSSYWLVGLRGKSGAHGSRLVR